MSRNMDKKHYMRVVVLWMVLTVTGCGGGDATASGGFPSDKQVVTDVMPKDKDQVVEVSVTKNKSGEAYLDKQDLNWYWDRGVVVKRKANMPEAPDAVVVVGGLARYVLVGDEYRYYKFLTTYNEYEGIPAPRDKELVKVVRGNLSKVFQSWDHKIVGIDSVEMNGDGKRVWHTPLSFTVPFTINYEYIKNNTTIETREDVFDIRFYRDDIHSPVDNLLASERSRKQLGEKQYAAAEIEGMKTLRSGL